jgi:hypothetical protein
MTAAGFVDPELKDRAQPAGQSIRACTGLHGLQRPTSQGPDPGIDDDCSWAGSSLYSYHGRNYLGCRQELFMHLLAIPQRV